MSDDNDDSQKTEEPSWRKLDEARSKGQVPQSREVTNWFVVLGATGGMMLFAPRIATAMQNAMFRFIEQSAELRLEGAVPQAILRSTSQVALASLPAVLMLMSSQL